MVVLRFLLLLLISSTAWALLDDDTKVTAEIESNQAFENQPIQGTVMVTHDRQNEIDVNSFLLDGKTPLKVQHLKDIQISQGNPLVISVYSFQLPAQEKGLYVLPRIQVKIGGKPYESILSSYEVRGGAPAPTPALPPPSAPQPSQPQQTSQPPVKPILKLDAFVRGKSSLYPGERTWVVYRYTFNTDVQMRKEDLPMLEPKGLRKIGSKQVKDQSTDEINTREIMQEVEAVNPGVFTYGPSVIEGYASIGNGQKQLLTSQAPPVTIKVNAVPAGTKPKNFNGIIGDFIFAVSLDTPSPVEVGDKVKLTIQATGKGDLSTVKLPDFCCLPGFEGLFSQSDLPQPGEVQGDKVVFHVELRPLSPLIKEIPSFTYVSYNPDTKKYVEKHTQAIPLVVKEAQQLPEPIQKASDNQAAWNPAGAKPVPIEIQGSEALLKKDLENRLFGTWWSLVLIPLGCLLLLFQVNLKKYLILKETEVPQKTSLSFLEEAKAKRGTPDECYVLLTQALLTKLKEQGKIDSIEIIPESLPTQGILGEVRDFLILIEKNRFAEKQAKNVEELLAKGSELYEKIGANQ